jgi:hypothetical protein
VVLALSNETEDKVSGYVDKHGLSIRVASGSNGGGEFGVRGIPASALIDTKGEVVWFGHPSSLSSKRVKEALKGAKKPGKGGFLSMNLTTEYGGKLKKAAGNAEQGILGKALASVRALLADETFPEREEATALEAEITEFVSLLESQAAAFLESREVLTAQSIYASLAASLKGHPECAAADEGLEKIESDDKLQDEVKAAELLAKANAEVARRGRKKAAKKFESVVKKYPGTRAAERAEKFLDSL